MRYATSQVEDEWLTLADLRQDLPKSKWRHSRVFEEVGVAIESGMTPSMFWALPDTDKAYVLAYYRTKATMQEYDAFLRDKEMKRDHKAPRSHRR